MIWSAVVTIGKEVNIGSCRILKNSKRSPILSDVFREDREYAGYFQDLLTYLLECKTIEWLIGHCI